MEVIYVLCGTKHIRYLETSAALVRENLGAEVKIVIYFDADTGFDEFRHLGELPWQADLRPYDRVGYDEREENRNNDLFKLIGLSETKSAAVYLDADVFVVDWEAFMDGFELASKFGIAMPLNPRTFIEKELNVAADVSDHDRKVMEEWKHMTAYNMGLMFYEPRVRTAADIFLKAIATEQRHHPSRGPMAAVKAMLRMGFSPYALPVNWLVCKEHIGIVHPVALHVGHKEVMEWWERDFRR